VARRARELELRRADVVAAASGVFAEKGFEGAQMNEIAAKAEVSTASVYALFEGKAELYQEVIVATARAVSEAVRKNVEVISHPTERLLAVIDSLFACWEENQDLLRIYARGTHGLPWKIREAMGESFLHLFREFTDWVEELAAEAQREGCLQRLDPEAFSLTLVGAATTVATRFIEEIPDRPLTGAARAVREIFERLLDVVGTRAGP
jgi:AcrR family transcriptional regulator